MGFWDLAWLIWALVAGLGFAALETVALFDKREGDTLSEKIRVVLGIKPFNARRAIAVPAFMVVVIGFTLWFIPHIVWDVV